MTKSDCEGQNHRERYQNNRDGKCKKSEKIE